jgi:hypothetical protein
MKTTSLFNLVLLLAVTPPLLSQPPVQAPASIPEDARRHFVMGTTLLTDAKAPEDFAQAESEFKQAVDLAPEWADARYKLASVKGAEGNYSGAMTDLKLCQHFKLSDTETRAVQDKIYVLEAKAGVIARKQDAAASEERKKQDYQDRIGFLAGTWAIHCTYFNGVSCSGPGLITISGNNISITYQSTGYELLRGTIEGDDYSSIKWVQTPNRNDSNQANLPDLPIQVTIDKDAPTISFATVGIETATRPWSWSQSQGGRTEIELTQ